MLPLSCTKQKTELPRHHSLKNLSNLLICIQKAFQVGITGNHKLNYTNVDFKFPISNGHKYLEQNREI